MVTMLSEDSRDNIWAFGPSRLVGTAAVEGVACFLIWKSHDKNHYVMTRKEVKKGPLHVSLPGSRSGATCLCVN